MTPGAWGLGGSEGGPRRGGSRPGVAARVGGEVCGQLRAVAGRPGLLSAVGKWCPGWGGLGGRVHPSGGRGVGTPSGKLGDQGRGEGGASTWARWAMPGVERPVLPPLEG